LPSGVWKKVLDSSDKMWDCPGTLLPEKIKFGVKVTIRGLSMALYKREEIWI
jgi:maltooligosyltrehalose trehalohydrolase